MTKDNLLAVGGYAKAVEDAIRDLDAKVINVNIGFGIVSLHINDEDMILIQNPDRYYSTIDDAGWTHYYKELGGIIFESCVAPKEATA